MGQNAKKQNKMFSYPSSWIYQIYYKENKINKSLIQINVKDPPHTKKKPKLMNTINFTHFLLSLILR